MAEEETQEQAPRKRPVPRGRAAEEESEAVKTDDDRYVGVDPIYKQSAYEEPLEVEEGAGEDDDEKEAVEREVEMLKRVKGNEAGTKVEVDEPESFEDWLPHSAIAARKAAVRGLDDEQVEADQAVTEEAKDEDGKIPPHSTSVGQPGVFTSG